MKRDCFIRLAFYLNTYGSSNCTGIGFIDSTPHSVCDERRMHQHRILRILPKRDNVLWDGPMVFKLLIITNDTGETIDLMVTKGNINDRKPLRPEHFRARLYGKTFGGKRVDP